jgi:ribosomal protein S18 acetylase RimI-like enzyme
MYHMFNVGLHLKFCLKQWAMKRALFTLALVVLSCRGESSGLPMSAPCSQLVLDAVQWEEEVWPEGTRAAKALFESRLATFPEGFICVRGERGELVGLSTSMRISFSGPEEINTWNGTTCDGTIANHAPEGNALYIVSLGVSPKSRGSGIGKRLVASQVALAKHLGVRTVLVGSRVPGFQHYQGDIESYLAQRTVDGRCVDPGVRFYEACGLSNCGIRSNYMTDDLQSRNYGVLMKCDL